MAARHSAPSSNERTSALLILGIGAASALASMLGSTWVVRGGVVVAIVMATIALFVAFKQIDALRAQFREQIREEAELRIALTDKHHADSVAMIERFNTRAHNLNQVILKLRSQLGAAKAELSSMRGNAAWLRAEVAERQARIEELEARIAELEARQQDEVVALPAADALVPSVEDLWGENEHPTMIDLAKLQIDAALDLPERKRA